MIRSAVAILWQGIKEALNSFISEDHLVVEEGNHVGLYKVLSFESPNEDEACNKWEAEP